MKPGSFVEAVNATAGDVVITKMVCLLLS